MRPEMVQAGIMIAGDDVLIVSGQPVAINVPYEAYLAGNYGRHTEWVAGVVIAMSPVSEQHDNLHRFLEILLATYLELTSGGRVLRDPMVMKTGLDLPARQPDLQVLLPDRLSLLRPNQVAGAANLVVEIVSPESTRRDRGEKYREYELGGVQEYWLIDPLRRDPAFYVLGEDGLFHPRLPENGIYRSQVLDRLALPVDVLWQDELPGVRATLHMVEAMLIAVSDEPPTSPDRTSPAR